MFLQFAQQAKLPIVITKPISIRNNDCTAHKQLTRELGIKKCYGKECHIMFMFSTRGTQRQVNNRLFVIISPSLSIQSAIK